MVYDLYDHPAQIQDFCAAVTSIWTQVAEAQLDRIPPFAGGYACYFYRAWAPERVVCLEEDASASFSPDTFRRFLLPADERLAASFPYTAMHVHSTATWPVSQLLSAAGPTCIEINYDDNGPRLPEILPVLRQIQEVKPLIIRGAFTAAEIGYMRRALSPRGLLLNIVADSAAKARELMAILRDG
jgi:hypothetical protein